MTTSVQNLEKKKIASVGALASLKAIELQIDTLKTHISARTGLASGRSALQRLEAITKSLRRNVTQEQHRVNKALTATDDSCDPPTCPFCDHVKLSAKCNHCGYAEVVEEEES